MKKIIYTIAFLLATGTIAQAQSPVLQSEQEIADFAVLENNLLLFTQKEATGQYIYSERWQDEWSKTIQKEMALNTGTVNTVIGKSEAGNEVYVYQKNGRNEEVITFYTLKDGSFEKAGERKLPKLKNHSANLGLYLSADKNTLVVSAELGKTRGYDDVYVSTWENNRWSKPKNLGRQVNTRQAEFAPFVAGDTLYFARKEGDKSVVYGAPFAGNAVSTEPVKLDDVVNAAEAYNAYYKKQDGQEYWIGKKTGNAYAIYERSNSAELVFGDDNLSFENAVSGSQDPGRIKTDSTVTEEDDFGSWVSHSQSPHDGFELDRIEAEKNHMVTYEEGGITMHYLLNQVYMGGKQAKLLNTYLKSLPKGTALHVNGLSDGLGSTQAKNKVSRQRAQLIRAYIQQNFASKQFKVTVESKVWNEVGKHFRVAQIQVVK